MAVKLQVWFLLCKCNVYLFLIYNLKKNVLLIDCSIILYYIILYYIILFLTLYGCELANLVTTVRVKHIFMFDIYFIYY